MAERRYPHDKRVTPWLLREYRKGRLVVTPQWQETVHRLMNAEQTGDERAVEYLSQLLEGDRPDVVFFEKPDEPDPEGQQVQPNPVQPGMVQNLIKMLNSYEKSQSPLDIMNKTIQDLRPEYDSWRSGYKERDPNSGEVVHTFPDKWTMRRVQGRGDLFDEGEEMQNCGPRFVGPVSQGTHHLFSLRDSKNNPHANVVIIPAEQGGHWDGGTVTDIRGKQNARPLPEYGQYIKSWFNTFEKPPKAHFEPGPPGDPGPGNPEDYGLTNARYGKKEKGWEEVVEERDPWIFESARMDYLADPQQRPDLQNKAGQKWLDYLRKGFHNDRTDILMPFLTKEWKAGRIVPGYGPNLFHVPADKAEIFHHKAKEYRANGMKDPGIAETYAAHDSGFVPLHRRNLEDRGEFLRSNHSAKRGLDLNNRDTTWGDLDQRFDKYQEWMRKRRDKANTVFKGPDGSYVKRLDADEVPEEGTNMNNCLGNGSYAPAVEQKQKLIYSVRDKHGNPHITVEMAPKYLHNSATGERMAHNQWANWAHPQREGWDQWEPMPQNAGVIQIHGKNNAPPPDKYAPMLKNWFNSKHFTGPEGEDWRPQWDLEQTHFDDMHDLYSPIDQHVTYYHPGDYGLENPGVTSDYKGLVSTLPRQLYRDPEHKRLPFLVSWARRQGELGDLQQATQDPDVLQRVKRWTSEQIDPNEDPGYVQWQQENPEPAWDRALPEGPECPNCSRGNYLRTDTSWDDGEPNAVCEWCGAVHGPDAVNPDAVAAYEAEGAAYDQARQDFSANAYIPWSAARSTAKEEAKQRLAEPAWQQSPQKAMLDHLQELTQQAQQGSPTLAHYACSCGVHESKWTLVKTANLYNKLRNQLRKSDQWTPENEVIHRHLQRAYPNHGKLAEWLHREVRKKRLTSPALQIFQRMQQSSEDAERSQATADDYRQRGDERYAEDYERDAEHHQKAVTEAAEQINDPEHLKNLHLTHRDEYSGKRTVLDPETMDALQEMLTKKKQREKGFNLMKTNTNEIMEELKEEALAKKARDAGTIVHTFPDDWTIRHIDNADEATLESDMLGHCLRDYGHEIESGQSHNYSLRDPKGLARLTLEIKHSREPTVDWHSIQDLADQDFECPSCHSKAHKGKCDACGFNLRDLQEYNEADDDGKNEINRRVGEELRAKQEGPPPRRDDGEENNECPNCGSTEPELEDRSRDPEHKWFCRRCDGVFYKQGDPEYVQWNTGHDTDTAGATERTRSPVSQWWNNSKNIFREAGLLHPDLRDGDAYQIQGKENVAPHPKYHRYLREWMGSIPYEERPKATWSSYFTKTPVLHVNDLEYGGPKGIDDFGFKWEDRPYNWKSILNSLHGDPKEWEDRTSSRKKFKEEQDPGQDKSYKPDLGQHLFDFAQEKGHLPDLMPTVARWGAPKQYPFRNMGEIPCASCGKAGYLHRNLDGNPAATQCAWCGDKTETKAYEGQLAPVPEPPPQYTPYQAGFVQHLGPQMAAIPGLAEEAEQHYPGPGYKGVSCQSCGSFDLVDYPGNPRYWQCQDCKEATRKEASVQPDSHIGAYGGECTCGWFVGKTAKQARLEKLADKFNDYLMSPTARPDLQTPEAQGFLQTLQTRYLNDKTDPLMPWLVREWKKGRVFHQAPQQRNPGPDGEPVTPGIVQYTGPEDYEYETPDGQTSRVHGLRPEDLNHWGDWYNSNHHTRQGLDIMNLQSSDLVDRVRQWNEEMREGAKGAAETRGEVVHSYPDGWTVQRLNKERQLKDEGEKMGHCVGGYWPSVQNGSTLIYSLRDHQNEPHSTWEITPTQDKCPGCGRLQQGPNRGYRFQDPGSTKDPCVDCGHVGETVPSPEAGDMVQIQGKGNAAPLPEYQQRLKDYFGTFKDRPKWGDAIYYEDADDFTDTDNYAEYHDGDYGLERPDMEFDWPRIFESTEGHQGGRGYADPDDVVNKAIEVGKWPELKREAEDWIQKQQDSFTEQAQQDWIDTGEYYFDDAYVQSNPPPEQEDYEDEDEYAKAEEQWEEDRDQARREEEEYYLDEWKSNNDDARRVDAWETAIADATYERRYRHGKRKRRRYHRSFVTSQPCRCTFGRNQPEISSEDAGTSDAGSDGGSSSTASAVLRCETCGNELEGSHCPQCDWGGWSNAMGDEKTAPGDNMSDPTKELKPAIQAAAEDDMNHEVMEALRAAGANSAPEGGVIHNMAWSIVQTLRENYHDWKKNGYEPQDMAIEVADEAVPSNNSEIIEAGHEEPRFFSEEPELSEEPAPPIHQLRMHLWELATTIANQETWRLEQQAEDKEDEEWPRLPEDPDTPDTNHTWHDELLTPDQPATADPYAIPGTVDVGGAHLDQVPNEIPQNWELDPIAQEKAIYNAMESAWSQFSGGQDPNSIAKKIVAELTNEGLAPDIAQEVSQEFLTKIYQAGDTFPQQWVSKLARNLAWTQIPSHRWLP